MARTNAQASIDRARGRAGARRGPPSSWAFGAGEQSPHRARRADLRRVAPASPKAGGCARACVRSSLTPCDALDVTQDAVATGRAPGSVPRLRRRYDALVEAVDAYPDRVGDAARPPPRSKRRPTASPTASTPWSRAAAPSNPTASGRPRQRHYRRTRERSLPADVAAYVDLPRLTGLALHPDGPRLVAVRQEPDAKRAGYVSALWEIPLGDGRPAAPHAVGEGRVARRRSCRTGRCCSPRAAPIRTTRTATTGPRSGRCRPPARRGCWRRRPGGARRPGRRPGQRRGRADRQPVGRLVRRATTPSGARYPHRTQDQRDPARRHADPVLGPRDWTSSRPGCCCCRPERTSRPTSRRRRAPNSRTPATRSAPTARWWRRGGGRADRQRRPARGGCGDRHGHRRAHPGRARRLGWQTDPQLVAGRVPAGRSPRSGTPPSRSAIETCAW